MSVIKCSHCGKDLPSEAKFCPYCMKRISEPVAVKLSSKKKNLNRKSVIIIIIALVIVLLTVGIVFFSCFGRDKKDNNGKDTTQSTGSTGSISLDNSTEENELSVSEDDDISKVISIKDVVSIVNDKKDESVSPSSNNDSTSTTSATTTETNKNNSVSKCEHNWVEITKTVHHDEVGHYETVENQRKVTKYKCPVCYEKFTNLDDYFSHFDNTHKPSYDGDPIKAFRNQYTTESGYEYYEEQKWVVDKKAYDETVVTGYKCSLCGEEKE